MMKNNTHHLHAWICLLALPFLLFSCYPGGAGNVEDLDLVGTVHDPGFNFRALSTYSMPDTVIHYIGEDVNPDSVDHSYDELIVSLTRSNMDALGYTYMEFDTVYPANLVLLASVISTTNSGIVFDPSWWWGNWGWWPGWGAYPGGGVWGPGWGYGMPWGWPVAYSYSTGTVFIKMIDPTLFDPDDREISVVWTGALNGLLKGSGGEERITNGINQAFEQSKSYLDKN